MILQLMHKLKVAHASAIGYGASAGGIGHRLVGGREGRAPCEKSRERVRQGVRVCRGLTAIQLFAIHRQAADRFVASVVPIASFVSSLAH